MPDFGHLSSKHSSQFSQSQHRNPLMAAYPVLWPYVEGGIEGDRPQNVSFNDHVQWALQYYDRRFRIHHFFPFVAFGIEQKHMVL